jgi:hypothetical protein
MLEIGKTLISLDVIQKRFCCDLAACLGACCVLGDSGAPLREEELALLEKYYKVISGYMSEEGLKAVSEQGLSVIDSEGDVVTPLINKGECAFVRFENGIALCSIENAYIEGKTSWKKPLSCHLYPIRIKSYKLYDAVNYDKWEICNPAVDKGNKLGLPLYLFVKDALVRAYGEEWFEQLDYAAKNLKLDEL